MAVEMLPTEREFRGPGCTDFCRWVTVLTPGIFGRADVVLHDATLHEEYGRAQAREADGVSPWDVATGPLLIRQHLMEAFVEGHSASLTPVEWRIVAELGRNLGHLVPGTRLLARVWGPEYATRDSQHILRVHIARLRAKLGPARALIANKPGFGYRLLREPYTGPLP